MIGRRGFFTALAGVAGAPLAAVPWDGINGRVALYRGVPCDCGCRYYCSGPDAILRCFWCEKKHDLEGSLREEA
jgi:hypothetical protein